ncbi:energy-coupling factor transporter transmembrane protein EcfT [Atopobacter sp. AH10]|uniref:energy-coupling factor transporter transmembrane component T family protein n=1 Tax=Atopobacter sp. AH10 TaxID=2315861 RepID=UPI000EF1F0E2|nr:energy-coupling factor transporter transmembrane component T [Atopobacter sp. AH10]RLK63821.1 energy-coupling factor transporter transmembrane protein EcfT [Atopobacter sp. AH10]
MNQFIFGRYIKGNSFVHQLDPRTKLLTSFFFIYLVFFANSLASYGLSLAFLALSLILSKIPVGFFLKGLKPMIWLIAFTVLLQLFFTGGEPVYWQWAFLKLTGDGIRQAVFIFFRFLLIILMSTLMTLTTPPLLLADALESLMKPLKKIKVPVHDIALMLSIALRFVPTLMDETQKIMNAQKSRGVDFDEGTMFKRIKAIIPILVPLFVSAFNRADDLAIAMEARGYNGDQERTKYRKLSYQRRDVMVLVAIIAFTLALFGLRTW